MFGDMGYTIIGMVNLFQEGPWKVASALNGKSVALAQSEGVNMSEVSAQ